jgi:PKD repeat protein
LKTAPSIAASIVVLALFAPAALAAPDPAFTVSPSPPRCGDTATYTDASTFDPLLAPSKVEWDFNNDGTYDVIDETAPFTATHVYGTRGGKTFKMRVTDTAIPTPGVTEELELVNVVTAAPQAAFTPSDATPLVNDDVLFASDPSDPDGDAIASYTWDFGDGSPVSHERNPVHQFASAGEKTITLSVTDSCGATSAAVDQVVDVQAPLVPGNALPVARFAFSPTTAQVGEPVEFVSSSFDRDGSVKDEAWDLDGDGAFDDGRGDDVLYTYTSAGEKTVRLRATDSAGATSVAVRQISVKSAPKPPPGFLRPNPKVRLNGLILSSGMRVRVLSARAPRGSLVTVRCKGKGCPAKQRRKLIKNGTVRFKTYQRFLRGGVRLEIFVSKPGKIGDYTGYTIRRGKVPKIVDRCLNGTRLRPVKC